MNGRIIAITSLIFTLLLTSATNAQPATRAAIEIIFPVNASSVSDTGFTFAWEPVLSADSYHIVLISVDGLQKVKLSIPDSECGSLCGLDFDPAFHSWTWREGIQYWWQVKAKAEEGHVIAKSSKATFTANMLPAVDLVTPENHEHFGSQTGGQVQIPLQWEHDDFSFFRVVIWKKNGAIVLDDGWWADHTTCSLNAPCGGYFTVPTPFVGLKEFKWQVMAKRDHVSGKVKSVKRNFSVTATE